ncbi:hypothetical protein [Magnetospirillum sp. SS-4]|uniref:hypothetical protein n=1 Tax=Magnetospirillum sp. SS-4 TaxID=2681465 RepID=UPI00138204FA|nr:hypothetical protein [Magnetospirillum sp. SS-4]CAA7622100.1 hypothetical protein MTBSS4_320024 [Magnetospirillum sp. SS-4]
MIIFDLREEAYFASYLYAMAATAAVFGAMAVAPRSLRSRMPPALAEAIIPFAFVFILAAGIFAWAEYDERRRADALVELCLNGGCTVVEGNVHDVVPVHKITSGGRMTAPIWGGHFRVGDALYTHYPRDHSNYSPANRLRDGEWARVHSQGDTLVLVEVEAGK